MYKSILSPHNNSISVKGIIWICTLNWFLFSRLHCSASYSNIYSVRPNTISILFLFINGILNVARFQNCATLVDISKVQKRAVSRISLFLERTLLFQSCLQLCHSEVYPLVCLCVMCTDFAHTTTASLASYNLLPSTIASSSIQVFLNDQSYHSLNNRFKIKEDSWYFNFNFLHYITC